MIEMPAIAPPTTEALRLLRPIDLLAPWAEEAAARHRAYRDGTPRGPATGLPSLDDELGGALAPGPHIVLGQPGVGKSALVGQVAATCGAPALLLTCEMGPLEVLLRQTARVTGTHLRVLKSGELAPSAAVALARKAVKATPLLAVADGTLAWPYSDWLRDAAEVVRGDSERFLLVVDSLHAWADRGPGDAPEYERICAAVEGLRSLAASLGCPVLAVAERNRASMRDGGLSAGAGSRKLEYCAESVWDLHRDADAVPDAAGEVPVTLVLAKNRGGAAGRKIGLRFHGALQRFREA